MNSAHYMLGKTLWKLYTRANKTMQVQSHQILLALGKAINHTPKPRDSKSECTLEPHYKLASIVHKLVLRGDMTFMHAAELLQQQPYKVQKASEQPVNDASEWHTFFLGYLKVLRNADKQHWHHRMISRVIDVLIHREEKPSFEDAEQARTEFQKSTFTRTMQIQVWRPEHERAGRHFVYMERYVRLMTTLLEILNDKSGIDQLARRVRKKSSEFCHFDLVWHDCCSTYLQLIRRSIDIPANMDEVFKTVSHDDFELFTTRVQTWIMDPAMATKHPALEALREAVELKKLNGNLMKSTLVDDTIHDIWALLYVLVGQTLTGPSLSQLDGASLPPTPFGVTTDARDAVVVNNSAGAEPQAPGEVSKPRRNGISRREVLRKADQAVTKITEYTNARPAGKSKSSEHVSGSSTGEVGDDPVSSCAVMPRVEVAVTQPAAQSMVLDAGDMPDELMADREPSLHDSADDESALSDVGMDHMSDLDPFTEDDAEDAEQEGPANGELEKNKVLLSRPTNMETTIQGESVRAVDEQQQPMPEIMHIPGAKQESSREDAQ